MNDTEKLIEIRNVCLEIDSMIKRDPSQWRGSLEWLTGRIMCIAKFGDGYERKDFLAVIPDGLAKSLLRVESQPFVDQSLIDERKPDSVGAMIAERDRLQKLLETNSTVLRETVDDREEFLGIVSAFLDGKKNTYDLFANKLINAYRATHPTLNRQPPQPIPNSGTTQPTPDKASRPSTPS